MSEISHPEATSVEKLAIQERIVDEMKEETGDGLYQIGAQRGEIWNM